MTGHTVRYATMTSSNRIELDFPYAGPQTGTLTLRVHPQHGRDVIVQIERGQIQCTSYDGCTVGVRFDDEAPIQWQAMGPADNSSESVFLQNYPRFLKKVRAAKRVRVSLPLFRNGEQVLEFPLPELDTERLSAK